MEMFRQRALPDLGANIQCGNSLIGPDYMQQGTLLDEEELYRVNPFDWEKAFPEAMQAGGFDAVIGNPPYISSRDERFEKREKDYYTGRFVTATYQVNTYALFMEKGFRVLARNGVLGYIIPNYWLSTDSDAPLRELVFSKNRAVELINVYKVFDQATVDTLVVSAISGGSIAPYQVKIRSVGRDLPSIGARLQAVQQEKWLYDRQMLVDPAAGDVAISFRDSLLLRGERLLGDLFHFRFGMKPYEQGKGTPPMTREMMVQKVYNAKQQLDPSYAPLIGAADVKRYSIEWDGGWIKYGSNLAAPRDPAIFTGPRILLRRIVSKPVLEGCVLENRLVCNTDVITLIPKDMSIGLSLQFVLGVLLSRAFGASVRGQNVNLDRAAFPKINANTLEKYALPTIDFSNPAEVALHNALVALVECMLDLHRRLPAAETPQARSLLERQIAATDAQIDKLVYRLYDLTPEEIALVEGAG
jgi:hypothetical protein